MPALVIDALLHPDGYAKHIVNFDEMGPAFLASLRVEHLSPPMTSPAPSSATKSKPRRPQPRCQTLVRPPRRAQSIVSRLHL